MNLTGISYKKWGIPLLGLVLTFAMSTAFADSYYTSSNNNDSVNHYFTSKNGYFLPKNLQNRVVPTTPKKDNTAQTLSANSQSLGMKGPFSFSGNYNNKLGYTLQGRFTKLLSKNNAISILLAYGEKQFRANFTLAHQFSATHRIKLTYEYLRQKLPFDFASGSINQSVGQSAFGADYQINLNKGIFHSVDIFATYSKAQSKNLPSVIFQENNQAKIDLRRIAGGTDKTAGAKLGLMPSKSILVNLGLSYDSLKYDTKYNTTKSKFTGIGMSLGTKILLNNQNEVQASIDRNQASDTYQVGVNHLFSHFELGLTGTYSKGLHGLMSSKSIGVTLSFPAPKSFSLTPTGSQGLLDWSSIPAVYRQQVLAIKDERVINANIGDNKAFIDTVTAGQVLPPIALTQLFNYPNNVFNVINYTVAVHSLRVTPKPAPQPTLAAANTKNNTDNAADNTPHLTVVKTSNTDGNIESIGKLPALAANYGPYQVTVTATGYLDGKAISSNVNHFKLAVIPAKLPSWKNFTLPTAIVSQKYQVNLQQYVINNSGSALIFAPGNSFPSWLTLSKSGDLTTKPGVTPTNKDMGEHAIDFYVRSDASGDVLVPHQTSIGVTLNAKGAPSWNLNGPFVIQVNASKLINLNQYVVNYQNATYSHGTLPTWMTISSDGKLSITTPPATALGQHIFAVSVTNRSGNPPVVADITIQITPNAKGAPSWNLPGPFVIQVNASKLINLNQYVVNHQNATYSYGTLPTWMTISSDGKLSITTPPATALGQHTFKISVSNNSGNPPVVAMLTIQITPNSPPVWKDLKLPNTVVGQREKIIDLKNYVNYPQGSTPVFSAGNSLPSWLKLNTNNGTLTMDSPTNNDIGKHLVELYVQTAQSGGSKIPYTTEITVEKGMSWNQSDIASIEGYNYITGISIKKSNSLITSGIPLSDLLNGKHSMDSQIKFKITPSKNAGWIQLVNSKIEGTPTQVGQTQFTIHATNSATGQSIQTQVTLTIDNPVYWNKTPTFSDATVNHEYTGPILLKDITVPDGKIMSFASQDIPAGLAINPSTGVITGKPTKAGTFTFHITAVSQITTEYAVKQVTITIKPDPLFWHDLSTLQNQLNKMSVVPGHMLNQENTPYISKYLTHTAGDKIKYTFNPVYGFENGTWLGVTPVGNEEQLVGAVATSYNKRTVSFTITAKDTTTNKTITTTSTLHFQSPQN